MVAMRENAIVRLASVTAHVQAGDGKQDLYTVPVGKEFIPVFVGIRKPTASLAGGTDFDFGDGANADTWVNAVDLSGMTAATDYYTVTSNNTKYTIFNAGDVFGVKPVTGATADADVTMDVFGYLFDA